MSLKPEKTEWDSSLFGKTYKKNEERCPIAFSLQYNKNYCKNKNTSCNKICNFSHMCDRHDKGKFEECGLDARKTAKSH